MQHESRSIPSTSRKRVLLLHGGWEGHQPEAFADFAEQTLLTDYDVTRSQDLGMLRTDVLAQFDILLPIWTFGEITKKQEEDLLGAVAGGLGYVGWHGNASSFLECRPHKLMLGGQFVDHPGGDELTYTVSFKNDPLTDGLQDFTLTSEQYYLLIDPAVHVLATTNIDGGDLHWLKGTVMPVAWKKMWGNGRLFYCALGHTVDDLKVPAMTELIIRALRWCAQSSQQKF